MFGNTGFGFIASAIKRQLLSLPVHWRTELNHITQLHDKRYITWVSESTDIPDCTVCYELFNGESTPTNAESGEKGFKITIIRNDVVRGRAEIMYEHKDNIPGLGLDVSILGPTDIEYMHEWLNTLKVYIPNILTLLQTVPAGAFEVDYE